jgi:hypothetical protein
MLSVALSEAEMRCIEQSPEQSPERKSKGEVEGGVKVEES